MALVLAFKEPPKDRFLHVNKILKGSIEFFSMHFLAIKVKGKINFK